MSMKRPGYFTGMTGWEFLATMVAGLCAGALIGILIWTIAEGAL